MASTGNPLIDTPLGARGDVLDRNQSVLNRIKGVILLSGSVRASKLAAAIGRSLLELPIDAEHTILSSWHAQASDLGARLGRSEMPVRVIVDHASRMPTAPSLNGNVVFSIERDPKELRGTGGVLRDLAMNYAPDDLLLVINGSQLLLESLTNLTEEMSLSHSDVSVVAHSDGTPSGILLVRCGVLDRISAAGFVDMKEQALPEIAKHHDVAVLERHQPSGLPIRMLSDYIHALRLHHFRLANQPIVNDPWAENLRSTFGVVESGATVHATARIHDSVVLAGATVDAGAILVRSLVCPGARVRRDQRIVDRIVSKTQGGRTAEARS